MAGALIVGVSYGLEVKPKDDPYVETAEKALHAISMAGNAGAYLVDSIPTCMFDCFERARRNDFVFILSEIRSSLVPWSEI